MNHQSLHCLCVLLSLWLNVSLSSLLIFFFTLIFVFILCIYLYISVSLSERSVSSSSYLFFFFFFSFWLVLESSALYNQRWDTDEWDIPVWMSTHTNTVSLNHINNVKNSHLCRVSISQHNRPKLCLWNHVSQTVSKQPESLLAQQSAEQQADTWK